MRELFNTYLKLIFGTSKTSLLFFPEFLWFNDVGRVDVMRKTILKKNTVKTVLYKFQIWTDVA